MAIVAVPRASATHVVATSVAAMSLVFAVLSVSLSVVNRHSPLVTSGVTPGNDEVGSELLVGCGYAVAGWALATRRPRVVFGWLALTAALTLTTSGALLEYGIYSYPALRLPLTDWAVWGSIWLPTLDPLLLAVTWAAFPEGRLPAGPARWLALTSVALCATAVVSSAVGPVPGADAPPVSGRIRNPLEVDLPVILQTPLVILTGIVLASATVVWRWRQTTGRERDVLRWLAWSNIVALALIPVIVVVPAGPVVASVGELVQIVVVVAVVLANNVYGIDLVLNRTLVYVSLSAVVALVYSIGVGLLTLLGVATVGKWQAAVAVAAAFTLTPARSRVQRLVNRFLYGERDEPDRVLTQIGTGLELAGTADQLLPRLLDSLVGTLRLPSAEVSMVAEDGARESISTGALAGGSTRFSLVNQGRGVGVLTVGLRAGETALHPREAELIERIAPQVAVAVANVQLTGELTRSRQRILAAGEEERTRLRRDLHDGLGPVLSASANKIDAARNLAASDPARSNALLVAVRRDLGTALDDLRRLVYALRPPALDELGLVGALDDQLRGAHVPVVLVIPDGGLPDLPPAVEIAAYRIVTEATTNVGRHAQASLCVVSITHGARLVIDVRDDGTANRPWIPGVGLSSVRERVAALGGTWTAGPTPAGGRLHVELPLAMA